MSNEVVSKWYHEVGRFASELLYLEIRDNGSAAIVNAGGEVATLATDWNVLMEANSLAELAVLLETDM